jgi:hypothetical protein
MTGTLSPVKVVSITGIPIAQSKNPVSIRAGGVDLEKNLEIVKSMA